MSVATKTQQAWDTSDYMRIVDAHVTGDTLVVLFNDHTWAEVKLDRLLSRYQGVRWDRMTFGHYTVIVPTDDGPIEISWLTIRSLSDPQFAAYLEAAEKRSLRQVGRQIRLWREESHMSLDELARAADLNSATLARIEEGDDDNAFSMLRRILEPLGRFPEDLAVTEVDDERRHTDTADRTAAMEHRSL